MAQLRQRRSLKSRDLRGKSKKQRIHKTDVKVPFPTQRLGKEESFPEDSKKLGHDGLVGSENANEYHSESSSEAELPDEAYRKLLQTLRTEEDPGPPKKRRRLSERDQIRETFEFEKDNGGSLSNGANSDRPSGLPQSTNGSAHLLPQLEVVDDNNNADKAEEDPDRNEDADELDERDEGGEELIDDTDSNTDLKDLFDPFEHHFVKREGTLVSDEIALVERNGWAKNSQTINETRLTFAVMRSDHSLPDVLAEIPTRGLKRRLHDAAQGLWFQLSQTQKILASSIFYYQDELFGARTLEDLPQLRKLTSLHILNHVLRTRDRVLKNSSRLAADTGNESLEVKDQGFTRPKVLLLLPTRQACVRFVECIISLFEPEQQENRARFTSSFAEAEEKDWSHKPNDFQDLFEGNDDDMFRIGIKFTRKALKFFSKFYQSDIILASPLGLRTAIEGKANKTYDADFLSSIEIAVVDHADALLMQNWENITYVFSQLNLLPKASHDCDFSRVRTWYLDGQAKYFRQTIVLSSFITPELTSLLSTHAHNLSGTLKITPVYSGAITSPTLPLRIPQTFIRFPSPTPQFDPSARFTYFTSTILPSLLRPTTTSTSSSSTNTTSSNGTLIFIPSYFSFVPLRNHLSASTTTSFTSISEYTSAPDAARARAHFARGRHAILLYTERAHHFRRYQRIRGCGQVVFYGVPENPRFWEEVVGFLGEDGGGVGGGAGGRRVRALFSKWDAMKLERVVGTERVGGLLRENKGDTFEFF